MQTFGQEFIQAAQSGCLINVPQPCCLVIFGASGDLARRKLIPSIFRLHKQKLLPPGFFVLGTGRSSISTEKFRELMHSAAQEKLPGECDAICWKNFSLLLEYQQIDYSQPDSYAEVGKLLSLREETAGTSKNRIFYLATPPNVYEEIIFNLKESGLSQGDGRTVKIVIEKPFGTNLESAKRLNSVLRRGFREEQIYRIDHYLAKETVQNILMFRFANSIFEPLWNRRYIDHIQITTAETLGIGQRAGYYEQAGVLRDMFQNHMFQLLSLTAMEPPSVFSPHRVRDEKAKVFQSMRPFDLRNPEYFAVIGQYNGGVCNGEPVQGYRDEAGVAPNSFTPTFAALKVYIDNWRWNGVPFYIRSGKRLKSQTTEISVHFKPVPHLMFARDRGESIEPNILILKIQPNEGITLQFQAKSPGSRFCLSPVNLDFSYPVNVSLDAYERVLLDCMEGDQMLFIREDIVDFTWGLLSPLIEKLEPEENSPLAHYEAGSEGPLEAAQLIQRDGRRWRPL